MDEISEKIKEETWIIWENEDISAHRSQSQKEVFGAVKNTELRLRLAQKEENRKKTKLII